MIWVFIIGLGIFVTYYAVGLGIFTVQYAIEWIWRRR